MLIKKCSFLDTEELAQLNKQLIEDEKSDNAMNLEQLQKRMQDFLKSEYDAYFFMEEDCAIGYALVRHTAKPLYLRQFFITRNFRRQGKGKAALKLLLDELKTDKIDIEVLSWNKAAIKFWESCGFTERSRYMRLENSESSFCIRKLSEADIPEALSLAWKVFTEYESPDYSDEGTESFRKSINDPVYLTGLDYYGTFKESKLVAICAIRVQKHHICFMFVEGSYHRRGIGSRLIRHVLNEYKGETVTLNSSPYGLPFYKALGFLPTDKEKTVNGIRFTPMKYSVTLQEGKENE